MSTSQSISWKGAPTTRRLPNAELVLYEDAGHGGIFQYHDKFVEAATKFLSVQ